ncbi:unnamed protein product [Rotaria magnacalcarata]|uniref:Uncharacterized protein n=2 Tax=Rotaria magnacalcarata TaxID=392030 RepID=A0A816PDH3_9BILA|nr:unnamed protein product [Rotaria magnacalcarata]CAF2047189.1 unnamed protein product [Rotaria magnacalcarata]CAF3816244.1 unnamed protein product [Rotaria magnacalcarata]
MANAGSSIDNDKDSDINNQGSTAECSSSFVLVWLYSFGTLDKLQLDHFRHMDVIKSVKPFTESVVCISHLSTLQNERVILILSTKLAKEIISIVHGITNIFYIYLFSNDSELDLQWMNDFSKVHGSYCDVETLKSKLLSDTSELDVRKDKTTLFNNESYFIPVNYNDDFIAFQTFVEILLSPGLKIDQNVEKGIEIYREIYEGNGRELLKIDIFASDYQPEEAVNWYTRDCFFPRVLNKSFRCFELKLLLGLKCYIIDLNTQLEHLYLEQKEEHYQRHMTYYAGMPLPKNEIEYLKKNVGCLTMIKTFLEATKDHAVACMFSGEGAQIPQFASVLFEIRIDQNFYPVRPFASVRHLSPFPDEDGVIFGFGFIFRIESVEMITDSMWLVILTATNEAQHVAKELINQFKTNLNKPINHITFGNLLNKLNKPKETINYYEGLLNIITPSSKDMVEIYSNLGTAHYLQMEYQLALVYLNKAFDTLKHVENTLGILKSDSENETQSNQSILLQSQSNSVATLQSEIYYNLGIVYHSLSQYDLALQYYKQLLHLIAEKEISLVNLAVIYNSIGSLYLKTGAYDLASEYFHKALDFALIKSPSNDPCTLQCLANVNSLTKLNDEMNDIASTADQLRTLSTHNDSKDSASS